MARTANLRWIPLLIVAMLVVVGCGDAADEPDPVAESPDAEPDDDAAPEPSPEEGEPIRIGLVADLTGAGAAFAAEAIKGVPIAVDQINAQGGVNGRPLEVLTEDSESRPEQAVAAATKLVTVDGVDALMVQAMSANFVGVAEYAATQDILVVNGGSSTPEIRGLPGTVVSTLALDDQVAFALADWVWDLGFRRAAVLVGNEPYGLGVRDFVVARFEELGGEIVADEAVELGQPDYRPELQRIANAEPELVFNATFVDDAQLQFRQLLELGVEAPWYVMYPTVVGVDDFEPAFGRLLGLEHGWLSDEAVDFRRLFEEEHGEEPRVPWPALTHDTLWLAAIGIAEATETSPEGYAEAIAAAAADYNGPSGTFEFDEDYTRTNQVFVKLSLTAEGFAEIDDDEAVRPGD